MWWADSNFGAEGEASKNTTTLTLRRWRLNIETGICQDIEKPNLVRLIIDR